MIHQLGIDDFLVQSAGHLTLDVRSEGEYHHGRIPHAVNLPLFNNDERKQIGTTYKQQSRNEAILQGLDIVGPKMSGFVKYVQPLATENKVFVHCWRGGMRSGSMAWLLNQFGYDVFVLKGGYKAYRNKVLEVLAQPYNYLVLGGKTGSGKTQVLQQLKRLGEQVVDLEELANHKGSAFGAMGQAQQPSSEHFENMVAAELMKLDSNKRVWLEDESNSIGKVYINPKQWARMRTVPTMYVELPAEVRVEKLAEEYGCFSAEELKTAFGNIVRRLGNEQWKNAIAALEENDIKRAAQIALHYYDKAYEKGLAMKENKEVIRLLFDRYEPETIAATLIQEANRKYGN